MRRHLLPAHTRGSSLVETLVATALGLLVLVMTTNSTLAVVVGESHGATTKALMKSVEFARAEAAQRRSPVAICGLDPRDAKAASGQVRCADPGSAWNAGWIVFGDDNLNGELDDGEAMQSFAFLPLRTAQTFGLLALGSPSSERFHPGMGTLYLTRLSELASVAAARFLPAA